MADTSSSRQGELNSVRDTFQSIWVAIVLAFVLRAFMFEAFAIPTGSMAPRLYGQHFDLQCPACGWEYAHTAGDGTAPGHTPVPVTAARCPNCRRPFDLGPGGPQLRYRNSGDRVFVLKYLYEFAEPEPWDVVVFKNPQDNRENYIKRLLGLPGETIEIVHGDIFVSDSPDPDAPRRVRRKPWRVQEAMWHILYDNDFCPDADWLKEGEPTQWRSDAADAGHWSEGAGGRNFVFAGADSPAWMRFDAPAARFLPIYGYNPAGNNGEFRLERDVICDLRLSAVFLPGEEPSTLVLETTAFESVFRAEVASSGRADLLCRASEGPWQRIGSVELGAIPPGRGRRIELVHADLRAQLRVDGSKVLETTDEQYLRMLNAGEDPPADSAYQWLVRRMQQGRKIPAPRPAFACRGGGCEVRHVRLDRDVYYTSRVLMGLNEAEELSPQLDYARAVNSARREGRLDRDEPRNARVPVFDFSSPREVAGWGTFGQPITLARHPDRPQLDEFFMLGDNSPHSNDGRHWIKAAPTLRLQEDGELLYQLGTVPRYNLIGKAIFVYWPAGFRIPGLPRIPIIPNVGKMRPIH
jgi:signal peptidase I